MTPEDVLKKIDATQKEIDNLSNIVDAKLDRLYNEEWSETQDFNAFDKKVKATVGAERKRINELNRIIRSIQPAEFQPLSDIGDLMTLQDFIGCVESGGFIDYDGHGYYAFYDKESNILVKPSDIHYGTVRKEFTHVVWYNR